MPDNITIPASQNAKLTQKRDYSKFIKLLQILSALFVLAMATACVVMIKKYDISIKNLDSIQKLISGGTLTIALGMIIFSIVKSFALVFPPAILFALSGILFKNIWLTLLVNVAATVLSLSLPYFLGRFTGKGMLDSLKNKFSKIKKIDDFAEANDFTLVFILKASGILPSDLSSLLFGAMGIKYKPYMLGANLGLLPINIMWTLLGIHGDLSNPWTFLYILPIILFAVICSFAAKKISGKKVREGSEEN